MIDHISLQVCDLARSGVFYEHVLAPLGYQKLVTRDDTIGFGKKYPELWLNHRPEAPVAPAGTGAHIALRARSQDAVQKFYDLALAHGGRCDGRPGERQGAMTGYYGAFVLDPDGNKIEALTFPGT